MPPAGGSIPQSSGQRNMAALGRRMAENGGGSREAPSSVLATRLQDLCFAPMMSPKSSPRSALC